MEKIRWGIMGAGGIAHKFAREVARVEGAELVAVGSRTAEKSAAFGDEFGIPRRYSNYEALARDPEVDIIYIATPHNFHCDNMLLCFENGKHVLCEKSFVISEAEAQKVIDKARSKRLFAMEAMWTRFVPASRKVCELIESGVIGDVADAFISLGFDIGENAGTESRIVSQYLAGGALLDVGIYAAEYASMIFGAREPESVNASALFYKPTGVDSQTAITLGYGENAFANILCSIRSRIPGDAVICGTKGKITVGGFMFPKSLTVEADGRSETFDFQNRGEGFVYEIEECMGCIRAGRLESSLMPLGETRSVMRTFDRVREIIGLKYPHEK